MEHPGAVQGGRRAIQRGFQALHRVAAEDRGQAGGGEAEDGPPSRIHLGALHDHDLAGVRSGTKGGHAFVVAGQSLGAVGQRLTFRQSFEGGRAVLGHRSARCPVGEQQRG
ncbi:hypothetical protein FQZ97_1137400 [compost metagenome]